MYFRLQLEAKAVTNMWHREMFWRAVLGMIFRVVNQSEALISFNWTRLKPLKPSLPLTGFSEASDVCLLKRAFQRLTSTEPHSDILFKLLNLLSFGWINKCLKCNPFLLVRLCKCFSQRRNKMAFVFPSACLHRAGFGEPEQCYIKCPCACLCLSYTWLSGAAELPN